MKKFVLPLLQPRVTVIIVLLFTIKTFSFIEIWNNSKNLSNCLSINDYLSKFGAVYISVMLVICKRSQEFLFHIF